MPYSHAQCETPTAIEFIAQPYVCTQGDIMHTKHVAPYGTSIVHQQLHM